MFNRILKITTSNHEQRWINLDRVTRVSMAIDAMGDPVIAFCFDGQDHITIHGSDEDSRFLIQCVTASLDTVAEATGIQRAASGHCYTQPSPALVDTSPVSMSP